MTAYDSLRSLLDYECLTFHCDWLGSDLRISHERRMKTHLQLNSPELSYEWLTELTNELVYNLGRTEYRPPPRTVRLLLCV
jgi:hypothetical protein